MAGTAVTKAPDDAQVAADAEQKVIEAISHGKDAAWELAEALYEFDEAGGWHHLGHETLEEWLAQPEVGITKTVYYNLTSSWRKFVVHRAIEPARLKLLEPSKVAIVANAVSKSESTVEDALSDVETLGYRDLRVKYGKKPKPAKEDPGKDEDPDIKPATTTQEESGRIEDAEIVANPITVDFLCELAEKRWHRKPTSEQVREWVEATLSERGLEMVPDLHWEGLEEVAGSGAKNPRIALSEVKKLLAWRFSR